MTVRDAMSTTVRVCRPDTDLAAVAKLMWDHDCGFVPVVDPAGGIVEVITDHDICMASATRRSSPERISATQGHERFTRAPQVTASRARSRS
jgi:CBS domain-containing protein